MIEKNRPLKRPRLLMPIYIKKVLEESGLMGDYELRPASQQNDYLRWIESAMRQETKEKRLCQMIQELDAGGVYMKMSHLPSTEGTKGTKGQKWQ